MPYIAKQFRLVCLIAIACLAGLLMPGSALAYQAEASARAASQQDGLRSFRSQQELDRFLERIRGFRPPPPPPPPPPPSPPSPGTVSPIAADSITNTQEAGVDEGGIVKARGDILVVLRRGKLFTLSVANGGMRPIDTVDAFPPGVSGSGDWYDELLIADDRVIVIGYSYARGGTEVNRFRLSEDGRLTFEDAHHLRSGDYYSSSNYASRLIGNRLIFYAPIRLWGWGTSNVMLPSVKRWTGEESESFRPIAGPRQIYATADTRQTREPENASTMHAVTSCDLASDDFECSATGVIAGYGNEFYVSPEAVYIWVTAHIPYEERYEPREFSHIYRLPLDGSQPSAIGARGYPFNQFSFREDRQRGILNVLVGAGRGARSMWLPEAPRGTISLIQVPLSEFGDGGDEIRQRYYRHLDQLGDHLGGVQARYIGDRLVFGHGIARGSETPPYPPTVMVVPLSGGGATTTLHPEHGVERIEIMGGDAIAIGRTAGQYASERALRFTTVLVSGDLPALGSSFEMPSAGQNETRSHAYFYRPDPGSPMGVSGTLGLPVARGGVGPQGEYLPRTAAMLFLRRDDRELSLAGEIASEATGNVDDGCTASCTDWYGNARPIFLRDRIFALLGYELVEGAFEGGRIAEIGRVDFTPAPPEPDAPID